VAGAPAGGRPPTEIPTDSPDTPYAASSAPEYASPEYWEEVRAAGLPSPWRGSLPNIVSFLATVASVYFVGAGGDLGRMGGVLLVVGLMSILMSHEMGHYIACRIYGVNATLPFFIPAPWAPIGPGFAWMPLSLIGTFGAVIRIKAPFPDRKVLFDVGIAGPLAGFVVACTVAVVAVHQATLIPLGDVPERDLFGSPLVFQLIGYAFGREVPDGMVPVFGPLGLAAWFGFLVTALNLMPVGQLDGGHVIYALFRHRSFVISRLAQAAGLVLLWFSPLWLVWMVVMTVVGRRHPPTLADHRPVGRARVVIGIVGLVVFALCFTPRPILVPWSEFLEPLRRALHI
jgi:membrane-associated protease RseP (regulator of RpoE activity)